jgi:hypothetical protein
MTSTGIRNGLRRFRRPTISERLFGTDDSTTRKSTSESCRASPRAYEPMIFAVEYPPQEGGPLARFVVAKP